MTFARTVSSWAACAVLACLAAPAAAQSPTEALISQTAAQRVGMHRAWFTQAQVDRARDRLIAIANAGDTLFAVTSHGVLHSIDAKTGKTNWAIEVGDREHPSLAPSANDEHVALINGSTLYLFARADGRLIWQRRVGDAPGAGPVLTKERVFVPMISGRIESYEIERSRQPPWAYYSDGRALVQPLASADSVCWPTDKGKMYVARAVDPAIRFRVETNGEIASKPAYAKPYLYAASLDGYVYAVHELSGTQLWRFSAGDPISEPPIAVANRVYVAPDRGGMYALDAKNGEVVWWTPKAQRFLAASNDHVYASDKAGRLLVIDIKTGAVVGGLPLDRQMLTVVNPLNDRVYLATESGLIQCLHDEAQTEPLDHVAPPKVEASNPQIQEGGLEAAAPEKAPADDADNPFGGGDEPPAAEPAGGDAGGDAGDDDPFGGGDAAGDDNPFE